MFNAEVREFEEYASSHSLDQLHIKANFISAQGYSTEAYQAIFGNLNIKQVSIQESWNSKRKPEFYKIIHNYSPVRSIELRRVK